MSGGILAVLESQPAKSSFFFYFGFFWQFFLPVKKNKKFAKYSQRRKIFCQGQSLDEAKSTQKK
jgi:hypothetical protein